MSRPTSGETPSLPLVEIAPGQRLAYDALLRLADDSESEIAGYRDRGTLFGLVDAEPGPPRGLVLADAGDMPGTIQLLSVAIAKAHQGRGLGSQMVAQVFERLRARGWSRVVVSTASSSVAVLGFYQRLGFRMLRIDRDWFTAARGYPEDLEEDGIPVRDRVWLDRAL
ncbi:MAG: GNAT family N-acetyltransferase [Myxococcota bacterium]